MSTDITLRVRGDDDGARRKLKGLEDTLQRLGRIRTSATVDVDTRRATTGISTVSRGLTSLERQAGRAALQVGRVGAATAVAGITATGVAVGKLGLDYVRLQESSRIAFTTMLKDGAKARRFMADLTAFAAKTPFELPGLVDSAQKMLAFGWEAKRVIPDLTAVGDAVAGLGGSPEKLDRVITAIGQIRAKGRVQAGEMLQLTENGIAAWDMLAKSMGLSVAEVMKLSEKGAISSDVAITALINGMNTRFGGMMAKQSRTIDGLYSTMMDNARQFSGSFVGAFVPGIKAGLDRAGKELNKPENLAMAQRAGRSMADLVNDELAIIGGDGTVGEKLDAMWARFDQTGAPDAIRSAITKGVVGAAENAPAVFWSTFKAAPWPAKAVIAALFLNRFGPGIALAGKALGTALGRAAGAGGAPSTVPGTPGVPGGVQKVYVVNMGPGGMGGGGGRGVPPVPVPAGGGRGGPGGRIPGGFGSPYPGPVAQAPGRGARALGMAGRIGVGALGIAGVPAGAAPAVGAAAAFAAPIALGLGVQKLGDAGKLPGFPSKAEAAKRTRELIDAQVAAWKQGAPAFKAEVQRSNPFANVGGQLDREVPKLKAALDRMDSAIRETSPKTRRSAKALSDEVLARFRDMPPAAQVIGADTAIKMVASLERRGKAAKGSTKKVVDGIRQELGVLPTAAQQAADQAAAKFDRIRVKLSDIRTAAQQAADSIRRMGSGADDRTAGDFGLATGGIIPGTYRGVDTITARLAPGERVARPDQVAAIDRAAGIPGLVDSTIMRMGGRIGGTAFASGGWVYPAPGSRLGGGPGGGTHSRSAGGPPAYLWQDDDAYDLMGAEDGKVLAPHAGTVSALRPHNNDPGFWGAAVYLSVPGGQFFLKHLKTVAVRPGQKVKAGEVIGTLGGSGGKLNGGPHLHIAANPLSLLSKAVGGAKVKGSTADDGGDEHGQEAELSDMERTLKITRGAGLASRSNIGARPGVTPRDGLTGKPDTSWGKVGGSTGIARTSGVSIARDLMSDTPDLSGGIATGPSGRESLAIRTAGSEAAARARAAKKKPEEVAKARTDAENEALKKFYRRQRTATGKRIRQALAEIKRLSTVVAKLQKSKKGTKAGRGRLIRLLTKEINDWKRELGELRDTMAGFDEALLDIGDQAADDTYSATFDGSGDAEAAAQERADAEAARSAVLQGRLDASGQILRGISGSSDIDPAAGPGVTVNVNVGGTLVTQQDVAGWLVGTLGNQPGSRRAVSTVGVI